MLKQKTTTYALDTKGRINQIVEDYRKMFPEEYKNFLISVKDKTPDNKFAELEGSEVIERQLGEMPETLYYMLQKHLDGEQLLWFNSKPGASYFYNNFKEFKITGGRV